MNEHSVDSMQSLDILSSSFLLGNVGAPFVIGLAVVGLFCQKDVTVGSVYRGGRGFGADVRG